MKKAISLFLTVILIAVSLPFYAYAETTDNTTVSERYKEIVGEYDADKSFTEGIVLTEGENKLELDGSEIPLSAGESICPKMSEEGELMVPADTLCKYINADYSENENGFDTITYEDRTLTLDADCGAFAVSEDRTDEIFVFDSIPYEKSGELMLPATEVADALGYECYEQDNSILLTRPYQSCRLLVSSKKNVNKLNSVGSIRDKANDITILQFDSETDAIAAEEYYDELKSVSAVQPDFIMTACEGEDNEPEPDEEINEDEDDENEELPNELTTKDNHLSTFSSEWHGVDDMNDYLKTQQLSDIKVAIVDTGVLSSHERFGDRATSAPVNFADMGVKDSSEDDNGHGTHVAGIILDNTLDNVSVIGVKVLNKKGSGTSYSVYEGVQYAATTGARVINMSLGGYGTDALLDELITDLRENQNITVCVAAGNDDSWAMYYNPANISACITVACVGEWIPRWPFRELKKSSFSNYGPPIDIAAVGEVIYSTYIYTGGNNGYLTASGTSMAAPAVTAPIAMMLSYNPSFTTDYIENRIRYNGMYGPPEDGTVYCDESTNNLINRDGWKFDTLSCSNLLEIDRTATPTANHGSDYYKDSVTVELSCEDDAEIYYTTDGTRASKENGTLYTEPLEITTATRLHFVACADGKVASIQKFHDYYVGKDYEISDFVVDKNGVLTDYTGEDVAYLEIPESVRGITVKSIAKQTFSGNKTLVSVKLPDTIKSLGMETFNGCISLTAIEANGVEMIGSKCFYRCLKLSDVNMPSLKEMGTYAFSNAKKLTSFSNDTLTVIPQYAFMGCEGLLNVELPNVTEIRASAFSSCYNIEHFSAPKTKTIGSNAFSNVRANLTHISFPNATNFGTEVFRGCRRLVSADLDSIETVEEGLFTNCQNLTTVNIPKATHLKNKSFSGCLSLAIIDFPSVERVDANTFDYDTGAYGCIKSLKLDNATTVGSIGSGYASLYLPKCKFLGASTNSKELQYIYAPLVETVGGHINAPNLKSVYMPSLKSVQTNFSGSSSSALFQNCTSLSEIDLPNLTEVTNYLFGVSDSNAEVSLKYLNVPKYEGDMASLFYNTSPDITLGKAPTEDTEPEVIIGTSKVTVTSAEPFTAYYDDNALTVEQADGEYILDTEVTMGSKISLNTQSDRFEAWLDSSGRVKSAKAAYSFVAGDDISLNAKYKTVGYVSFYNANGDLICSGAFLHFTENDFPAAPVYYGHTFKGWNMTADEINASIQNGESVTVTAMFEKNMKYYSVNVTGGYVTYTDSDDYNGANSYRELSLIKIKPNYNGTTPFAYWKSSDGSILSYHAELSFYVLNSMDIFAVYSSDEIKHQPIIRITNAVPDKDGSKITFAAQREIPSDCTVLSHGIILTSDGTIDENTFIIGADGVLKGTSVKTANSGTYTLYKSNVNVGDTWYARGYVNYKTADGKVKTIYSDIVSSTMEE